MILPIPPSRRTEYSQYSDIWVFKLDSNGNVSWQKTYGLKDIDYATTIQQTSDGGYIIAGTAEPLPSPPDGLHYGRQDDDGMLYVIWVLKLDSIGNISWQKAYEGRCSRDAHSVQQTFDGGYIVVGETIQGRSDICILKLDSNGNINWEKSYGGSEFDYARSIQQTFDGGYIVGGETLSFGSVEYPDPDIWVFKLDSEGNVSWQKTYGGSHHDGARSIKQTTDGGYIVTGYTNSFGTFKENIWVLKLDSEGEIPNCDIIGSDTIVINTSVTGQDTDAIAQSTSASIVDTNLAPQEYSAEIITLCEGDHTTTSTITIPTTTTACIDPCCTEQIYGEYSEEAKLLRYIRDNILNQTPEGQEIIKLYYKWSPAIVKAMDEDEGFKEDVKEMIDGVLGLIEEEVE